MLILYFISLILFLTPICIIITQQFIRIVTQHLLIYKLKNSKYNNLNMRSCAEIYIQRKLWLTCIILLENTIVNDNQYKHEYQNLIGLCYLKMQMYEASYYHYKEAIKDKPDNIISLLSMAKIYKLTKKYNQAINVYSQILEMDKHNKTAQEAINNLTL